MVDRAVLEPSGVISFVAKEPSAGEVRHHELTGRLEKIDKQLAEIRAASVLVRSG